jgi:predicted molibdopterin-dependent oxidoreductase YjgC
MLRALQKAMLEASSQAGSPAGAQPTGPEAAGAEAAGAAKVLPGQEELTRMLGGTSLDDLAGRAGLETQDVRDAAGLLVGADSIVIIWGERIAQAALVDLALVAGVDDGATSGLIEVPSGTNCRGLREVGCVPNIAPGLEPLTDDQGRDGEPKAFYLLHSDPVRELPDRRRWEDALAKASFVVARAAR